MIFMIVSANFSNLKGLKFWEVRNFLVIGKLVGHYNYLWLLYGCLWSTVADLDQSSISAIVATLL